MFDHIAIKPADYKFSPYEQQQRIESMIVGCWHFVAANLYPGSSTQGMYRCLEETTKTPIITDSEKIWRAVQAPDVSAKLDRLASSESDIGVGTADAEELQAALVGDSAHLGERGEAAGAAQRGGGGKGGADKGRGEGAEDHGATAHGQRSGFAGHGGGSARATEGGGPEKLGPDSGDIEDAEASPEHGMHRRGHTGAALRAVDGRGGAAYVATSGRVAAGRRMLRNDGGTSAWDDAIVAEMTSGRSGDSDAGLQILAPGGRDGGGSGGGVGGGGSGGSGRVSAGPPGLGKFTWLDSELLEHNRQLYMSGHAETAAAVARLVRIADAVVSRPFVHVADKPFVPPTGDKRTYVSLAVYCWPSNPDNLQHPEGPWTCHDGHEFKGRHIIAPDFRKMMHLHVDVIRVGLAWHFTRSSHYADWIAGQLRVFYLDPETGMLPSLKYAQLKPGYKAGAPTGTIDNKNIGLVFDALALIAPSGAWRADDDAALREWAAEYLPHLRSAHVKSEAMAPNNHGSWFDVQYLSLLTYLGWTEEARAYIEAGVKTRLQGQILGAMLPSEIGRPKSHAYCNFLLEAQSRIAMQAARLGIDLWTFRAAEGNSMLDAWDWMAPHWCDRCRTAWPVPQMLTLGLEIHRPATHIAAAYTAAARAAGGRDAYTLRSRHYAQLFQTFNGGPDIHGELNWNDTLAMQLALVRFDDCFIALCPGRAVVPVDAPAFNASCVVGPDEELPPSSALQPPRMDTDLRADGARRPPPPLPRLGPVVAAAIPGVTDRVRIIGIMPMNILVTLVGVLIAVLTLRRGQAMWRRREAAP